VLSVEVLASLDRLESLRPEWDELLARSPTATIFQTHQWQLAWLRHLGGGRLLALAVRDGRDLVGLAPLVVRRAYGTPFRRLQFVGTGPSDYLGVVAADGQEAAVWGAVLERAWDLRHLWDVLDLQQVRLSAPPFARAGPSDGDAPVDLRLSSLGTGSWLRCLHQAVCPHLPLPGSRDAFIGSLGKKARWNLRYYLRALGREHKVEMGLVGEDNLAAEMEALFRLHGARWRKRWLPGVLALPSVRRFHRQVAAEFLRAGWLRLFRMQVDGATVASIYCFSYGGVGCYYLSGFDPAYARQSVGTVLTGHAIGELAEEGCRELDFLRGAEPYKYRWGCVDRHNARLIGTKDGAISALAAKALIREQRIADAWERRAHGCARPPAEADGDGEQRTA